MCTAKKSNNTLPLNKNESIALIGPLVKDKENIIGNWAALVIEKVKQ